MNTSRIVGIATALGFGLLLLGGPAYAQSAITGPPWGDDGGPKLVFGSEDQGVVQFDYKGQFRMSFRNIGSGTDNLDSTTNFGFRRNRLALRGAWGEKLSVYVQTEFTEDQNIGIFDIASSNSGSTFQLLDAVLRFDLHESFKINVGKFKYNLSRENLEVCEEALTLDRSSFIRAPYVGTRDNGVAIWGNLLNDRLQYRVDAMEGRQAVSGQLAPSSKFRYSGRGHVSLLDPETAYGYKATYLGEKKVLTFGGAYQYEPKVTYTDSITRIQPKDYKAWTFDGFFEYPIESLGTVTLSGAYEKVDMDGAYQGAHPDSGAVGISGEKNGWYGKAGYLPPRSKVQLFGRYEKWRFASLNGVYDEIVDSFGGGAHYYIWGHSLKLSAEFNRIEFDQASRKDFTSFVTQMQLIF